MLPAGGDPALGDFTFYALSPALSEIIPNTMEVNGTLSQSPVTVQVSSKPGKEADEDIA